MSSLRAEFGRKPFPVLGRVQHAEGSAPGTRLPESTLDACRQALDPWGLRSLPAEQMAVENAHRTYLV